MIDRIRSGIGERVEQLLAEAEKLRRALVALDPRQDPAPPRRRRVRTPPRPASTHPGSRRGTKARSRSSPSATKRTVLGALAGGGAMTAGEVARATGLKRETVSTTLSRLAKSGEVVKAKRGYRLPEHGGAVGEASAAEAAGPAG